VDLVVLWRLPHDDSLCAGLLLREPEHRAGADFAAVAAVLLLGSNTPAAPFAFVAILIATLIASSFERPA